MQMALPSRSRPALPPQKWCAPFSASGTMTLANLYPATRPLAQSTAKSTTTSDGRPAKANGQELERELRLLQAEAAAFAESIIKDPKARLEYMRRTSAASDELIQLVQQRKITPHEAAQTAHAMRNQIMALARSKLSDFGLAVSRDMKPNGPPLGYFEERYAQQLYGKRFAALSPSQREAVWLKIVDRAGKANPKVNTRVRFYGTAGRTFLALSLGMAVYNVATAEDKPRQLAKEGATAGAGVLGGLAGGGIVVALASNPAGWLVLAGVIVGGGAAGLGADSLFDYFWPER